MTWWVAGAVVGGAVLQSNAAGNAASAQADATAASIAEQQRQFDLSRGDYAPYREAGNAALSQLMAEQGFQRAPATSPGLAGWKIGAITGGGSWQRSPTYSEDVSGQVMQDPGYQFGLRQGQLGLDRKAAAAGGRISGAALKAATQYATDYASTGYNAAYQRRQDRLNRLASLAGLGQTATGGSAQAGAAASGAISNALSAQGNASAAAGLAQGNIWGNTLNQLGAVGQRWASGGQIAGFNGNNASGYTNINPESVGPSPFGG